MKSFALTVLLAAVGAQASWNCILPKAIGGTAVNAFGDCVQDGNLNDVYPCRPTSLTGKGACKVGGNGCTPYARGSAVLGTLIKYADCS